MEPKAYKELGLPTKKMDRVLIAFDVDGTLLDNTKGKPFANERIRTLLVILSSFKNTYIIVWSGSGQMYAEQIVRELHLLPYVDKIVGKVDWDKLNVDVAIDDIQDTALGKINLIVREK